MKTVVEQMEELKRFYPNARLVTEGGIQYIYIPDLKLPSGCTPEIIEALLCPVLRDGYHTRLFYSEKITGIPQKNWNGNIRICDRNWLSYSWKSREGMGLLEMIRYHLSTLNIVK